MMDALIIELETVTEGSRELDIAITKAVFPKLKRQHASFYIDDIRVEIEPFTTSLDAALSGENIEVMALHEAFDTGAVVKVWEAWHVDKETRHRTMGAGHTEALARRLAYLKAL